MTRGESHEPDSSRQQCDRATNQSPEGGVKVSPSLLVLRKMSDGPEEEGAARGDRGGDSGEGTTLAVDKRVLTETLHEILGGYPSF